MDQIHSGGNRAPAGSTIQKATSSSDVVVSAPESVGSNTSGQEFKLFEQMTEQINDKRRSELEWLHQTATSMAEDVRSRLGKKGGVHGGVEGGLHVYCSYVE